MPLELLPGPVPDAGISGPYFFSKITVLCRGLLIHSCVTLSVSKIKGVTLAEEWGYFLKSYMRVVAVKGKWVARL